MQEFQGGVEELLDEAGSFEMGPLQLLDVT